MERSVLSISCDECVTVLAYLMMNNAGMSFLAEQDLNSFLE